MFASFCLLVLIVRIAAGAGYGELELTQFLNPSGHGRQNKLCDSSWLGGVSSQCDHYFEICLSSSRFQQACDILNRMSAVIHDRNLLYASDFRQALRTLRYAVQSGSVANGLHLKVSVHEYDQYSRNELVEVYSFDLSGIEPNFQWTSFTKTQDSQTLSFQIRVSCNADFFGSDCTTYCVPQSNRRDGYYRCSAIGNKICLQGWTGLDCLQQITSTSTTTTTTTTPTTTTPTTTTPTTTIPTTTTPTTTTPTTTTSTTTTTTTTTTPTPKITTTATTTLVTMVNSTMGTGLKGSDVKLSMSTAMLQDGTNLQTEQKYAEIIHATDSASLRMQKPLLAEPEKAMSESSVWPTISLVLLLCVVCFLSIKVLRYKRRLRMLYAEAEVVYAGTPSNRQALVTQRPATLQSTVNNPSMIDFLLGALSGKRLFAAETGRSVTADANVTEERGQSNEAISYSNLTEVQVYDDNSILVTEGDYEILPSPAATTTAQLPAFRVSNEFDNDYKLCE